ncbi:MAG: right-handed parallel beta-helix repeat-containing protein [Lachnospira sp.]|nr:right-handed parallel beta-helix repeat-containing protein [Lachnospira sp.]
MKKGKGKKILAILMAALMVVGIMPMDWAAKSVSAAGTTTYTFDATTLTVGADKDALTGKVANGYVTVFGTVIKRNASDNKSVASTDIGKDATGGYEFTVTGTATAKIVISSTGSNNTSAFSLVNAEGTAMVDSNGDTTVLATGSASAKKTVTYELTAGTYKMTSTADWEYEPTKMRDTRVYSFEITETSSGTRPPRADWSTVANPTIGTVSAEKGKVTVPYTMVTGYDGADKVVISMIKDGKVVDSEEITGTKNGGEVEFTPASSGDYSFTIVASREGEADKTGEIGTLTGFELPLEKPSFQSATSAGGGKVNLVWNSVTEATSYEVSYSTDGTTYSTPVSVEGTAYAVSGLTVGTTYTFKVVAVRKAPAATEEATIEATATADAQQVWSFSAFGDGASSDSAKNGYSGSANDGKVSVWGWAGKIVPATVDGLSFYYTAVPSSQNFTLSANVTVDKWTLSNGQEGFGLMACDRIGKNGVSDSKFFNNSYMNSVTKVEYYADAEGNVTDDTTASKISMKVGIGSQEKKGVTPENLERLEAKDTETINNEFSTKIVPLDTRCASLGTGTYNMAANATKEVSGTIENPVATYKMTIQKNNTGYFVSYTDEAGNTTTKKYYDTKALEQLDPENVYVGFYASRNAQITVTDINFTSVAPEDDAPAEEQPVTEVTPSYTVTSGTVANSTSYKLTYISNADGHVVVTDKAGNVVADQDVTANKKVTFDTTLELGKNKFTVTATPAEGYRPSEFEKLSSYDAVTFEHTVTYDNFNGDVIYVGTEGTSSGKGTKENPVDVYTAVKYAKPGQYIVVLSGTYNLDSTVKIERGVDGTAEAPIRMIAEAEFAKNPQAIAMASDGTIIQHESFSSDPSVFDFGRNCEGMVIAGNYWYIQGLEVTNSANGKDGVRLSGSNVTLDGLRTYHNGNTGIQISRYVSTDLWEDWPANNLVLNCTSYGNADEGYEDADGFAAKLTIGNGNVFDGCVAYNNADDGWDLFAKAETGKIGSVTIQNCVAYANGYLEDGTNAGNGNGFKMGGSSLSGYHKLIDSVSFDNKAKGIDSNSCPDIQVTNCTTFNNGSYNVAFYTNDAKNTDFMATGVLSYRTQFTDVEEQFKLLGTQETSKVYNDTNYFWNYVPKAKAVGDAYNSAVEVDATWFATENFSTGMDYTTHTYAASPIARNANGTIDMKNVLVLSSTAKAGAVVKGQASALFTLEGLSMTSGLIAPKTGDSTTALPFVIMMILSAAMVAGVYFYDKKRKMLIRR